MVVVHTHSGSFDPVQSTRDAHHGTERGREELRCTATVPEDVANIERRGSGRPLINHCRAVIDRCRRFLRILLVKIELLRVKEA